MPKTDWDAERKKRDNVKTAEDEARTAYVNSYTARHAIETAIFKNQLQSNQQKAANFIKSSGFTFKIREIIRIFDPTPTITSLIENQPTPLGGEVSIDQKHVPAFILESRGKKTPSGAPGIRYTIHFGIERRVEIIATICLDTEGNPYLFLHLISTDGRSHQASWDSSISLSFGPDSRDLDRLESWLKSEIMNSGIKTTQSNSPSRQARIFLPD